MSKPILYLMRGQSGSGKSTWIRTNLPSDTIVCSADQYFYDSAGVYCFDPSKLSEAHDQCWRKAFNAIDNRMTPVAIDNTNANPDHAVRYLEAARVRGYTLVIVTCLTDRMNRGIHGCPESTARRHWDQIMCSLRPYDGVEYLDVYTD